MYPYDIWPFLEDELYKLDWSHVHQESILNEIYTSGKGVLDPTALVHGESWLDDALKYGFADAPMLPQKPYAAIAPVSSPSGQDLLTNFPD